MLAKFKKKYIGDWDLQEVSFTGYSHDPAECHYQSGKLSG